MALKNTINNFLRKFNVEMHGLGYLQSLAKGDFKNDEMNLFKNQFKNDEIVIYDVGANRGFMIKNFIDNFSNASIHAFEPYKPLYMYLKNEFEKNKNVVINGLGISDRESELIFNVNNSVDTSSFLASKKTGLNSDAQVQTQHKITIPVTTIDNYAQKFLHERIHILKLDIQGSELNALKGAVALLKEKKIDIIFSETYFVQQYEGQPLLHEIITFLHSFGYIVQDIYHPIYGKGKLAWCDTLFVRENLKLI